MSPKNRYIHSEMKSMKAERYEETKDEDSFISSNRKRFTHFLLLMCKRTIGKIFDYKKTRDNVCPTSEDGMKMLIGCFIVYILLFLGQLPHIS